MKVIIDTNALLRYFLDDIPDQAKKVEFLLENESSIFIPDVVFIELDYTLRKYYKKSKDNVEEIVKALLYAQNIRVNKYISEAFSLYISTSNSFSDCIIASQARGYKLASFDRKLVNIEGIQGYF